jgi:hypothetical protein
MECTGIFLQQHFPDISQEAWKTVNVYFHQYGTMSRCKLSMYNHFAALLPATPTPTGELPCLNEVVNQVGLPWWTKTDQVNGYDCLTKAQSPFLDKWRLTTLWCVHKSQMMSGTPTYTFFDCAGMHYYVEDVPSAGDCALLALLMNPEFNAPCASPDELRRLIVTHAQGPACQDCSQMFAIVGDRTNFTFEVYLDNVLRPRFWVGTIFFLWTSVALGVKI